MKHKNLNRIGFISSNALRQIIVSAFGIFIPFMVIRYASKEIWGEFVSILLFTLLALQIVNWGNKEYLLRKFSLKPNTIAIEFSRVLYTRLPLVILFSIVGLWLFSIQFGAFIFVWILGRFIIHSTEVLVVYEKKFTDSLVIESVSFLIFCVAFYSYKSEINLTILLIIYSFYQFIKGVFYFILFKNFVAIENLKLDLNFYKNSFWYFLLSILGFLASKIDVYIMQQFGNKINTSDYQIINSLLVFTMSLSAFIYVPFTKNIYRNTSNLIQKTEKILATAGLIIVPISLFLIQLILKYYLNLELHFWFYLIAFLYIYPSFLYGIEVVNLFKQNHEKRVLHVLFIGALSNGILAWWFLNLNYGFSGTLLGGAIAQIIVLLLFKIKKIVK